MALVRLLLQSLDLLSLVLKESQNLVQLLICARAGVCRAIFLLENLVKQRNDLSRCVCIEWSVTGKLHLALIGNYIWTTGSRRIRDRRWLLSESRHSNDEEQKQGWLHVWLQKSTAYLCILDFTYVWIARKSSDG